MPKSITCSSIANHALLLRMVCLPIVGTQIILARLWFTQVLQFGQQVTSCSWYSGCSGRFFSCQTWRQRMLLWVDTRNGRHGRTGQDSCFLGYLRSCMICLSLLLQGTLRLDFSTNISCTRTQTHTHAHTHVRSMNNNNVCESLDSTSHHWYFYYIY